jgi:hypothetical protein
MITNDYAMTALIQAFSFKAKDDRPLPVPLTLHDIDVCIRIRADSIALLRSLQRI